MSFIRSYSSNENTFRNKVIGSIVFAGRHWLHLGTRTINTEWYLFHKVRSHFACKVEWGSGDGDDGITLHAAVPWLFSIYFSVDRVFGKLFHHPNESRQTGIAYHNETLWIYPFSKTMSWSSKDRWWNKYISWSPSEFICGRNKYSEITTSDWQDIVITMPEGKYKGKIRLFLSEWKNRFRTKRIERAEIEMEEGIPFPGKGENSWDCGEDASFGLTCPAKSEPEAIASMIENVLTSRRNYGCRNSMFEYTPTKRYTRSKVETPKASEGNSSEAVSAC